VRLPPPLPFHHPAAIVSTWFGAGLLPRLPGTWGSLAALPFAWAIASMVGNAGLVVAALALFLIGWWAAGVYIRSAGVEDPGAIVVDEVAAQWLVLAVVPREILWYLAAFVLFRVFDIVKPWPIAWADRVVKGGLGTMVDDVLAAAYAGAIVAAAVWLV